MSDSSPDKKDPYCLRIPPEELPPLAASDLAFFRSLAQAHGRWLLPMAAFMAVAAGCGICLPKFTQEIIDGIRAPAREFPELTLFIVLFGACAVLGQAAGMARSYFQTRFRQGVSYDLRSRVLSQVHGLPPRFFDREETGYLMSRVWGDTVMIEGLISNHLVALVTDVAKFTGGVVILFAWHWKLAIATSLTLPLLGITIKLFRNRMGRISDTQMEANASFFKDLQESFAGILLIKSAAKEAESRRRLLSGIKGIFTAEMPAVLTGGAASAFMALSTTAGVIIVLWLGAREVLAGNLTVGKLVGFNMYLAFLYGPTRSLSYLPIAVQPALVAFRRIKVLLGMPVESTEGLEPESLSGRISIKGVTFTYPGGTRALEDVSLEIEPGGKIGIAGPSGAGKSTMAKLILGFYPPDSGRISVDGSSLEQYSLGKIRSRIGFLSQDSFFFSDTLRGNLKWAQPGAADEELVRALRFAGLGDFLAGLEKGLDTPIGERGLNLSGGERQRLAIARLIVEKPDMVIMDESTSFLDRETEAGIRAELDRILGDRTIIVIAHRLSSFQGLDQIVVIEKGRIVQKGTPDELLKSDGPFRRLYG
jgi:subfamily B ATP-binding cassette protein MsbA